MVDRDDAAGALRCGGCAAYASIASPPCPSTVVVPERKASVILRSLSFCEGVGSEPAVGNAAQARDGAARIQRSSSVSASMSIDIWLVPRCGASPRCAYWYNQAHLHSALGHVPPLELEQAHGRQVTPAQQPVARRTGPPLNPRAVQDTAITQPEFSFASRTTNAR